MSDTTAPTALDQLLLDLFTTALEGGINYWSVCSFYRWWSLDAEPLTESDYRDFYADIVSEDEDWEGTLRIDRNVLRKGYGLATGPWRNKLAWSTDKPPVVVGPETDWDYDAGDADMIVQLGLFGEVVYG